MVAVSLIVMLGATGLAVDLGRGYVTRMRLGRAVDAAALAAARSLRSGQLTARNQALAVARANGVSPATGSTVNVLFGANARGEVTVTVTANRTLPTTFMRVLGQNQMNIGTQAQSAISPIDMVLVLDQSGSLATEGAWQPLQQAATAFVQQFSDVLDQVGLVSYQVIAADRFSMNFSFSAPITQAINAMPSVGDTNTGEGLRFGLNQLQAPNARPSAVKVVVFFTDGRPTALRDQIGSPGNRRDRVIAVYTTGTRIRGYFNNPDLLNPDVSATASGCVGFGRCFGWNENAVRNQGRVKGLQMARQIRQSGATIYSIGLGNPNNPNPLLTPDLGFLRQIANENGVSNPNEPQGKMHFAPSAAQLQSVFNAVANDIMVRLAQ